MYNAALNLLFFGQNPLIVDFLLVRLILKSIESSLKSKVLIFLASEFYTTLCE